MPEERVLPGDEKPADGSQPAKPAGEVIPGEAKPAENWEERYRGLSKKVDTEYLPKISDLEAPASQYEQLSEVALEQGFANVESYLTHLETEANKSSVYQAKLKEAGIEDLEIKPTTTRVQPDLRSLLASLEAKRESQKTRFELDPQFSDLPEDIKKSVDRQVKKLIKEDPGTLRRFEKEGVNWYVGVHGEMLAINPRYREDIERKAVERETARVKKLEADKTLVGNLPGKEQPKKTEEELKSAFYN